MKKTKKSSNELIYLGVGLFLLFFYMKTKQGIINYPVPTYAFLLLIAFIPLLFFVFFRKQSEVLESGLTIIRHLFVSWVVVGILLIPFNIYLKHTCSNSNMEQLELSLLSVSTYSENRCFFYEYQGDSQVYYGYKPIMTQIYNANNASEYKVVFNVRKGAFDTFVIYKWDILKK